MLNKPLNLIDKNDIDYLYSQSIPESLILDYKRDLYDFNNKEKKQEFLEDVTAFANSSGGDIVIGVDESEGIPTSISGVPIQNLDKLKLDIENTLRDLIQPRLPNIEMQAIDGFEKGPVFIIRIPKSWAAPHMVNLGKNKRFCGRNGSSKFQMDIQQIRSAFLALQNTQEQIQNFISKRIAKTLSNEGSFQLEFPFRLMLNIIPMDAFEVGPFRDMAIYWSKQEINDLCVEYIDDSAVEVRRFNFDGFYFGQQTYKEWYVQFFRNGAIEFVSNNFAYIDRNSGFLFYHNKFENNLVQQLDNYFKVLNQADIPLPYIVSLSYLNIKGLMRYQRTIRDEVNYKKNEEEFLTLEPMIIRSADQLHAGKILKPMLDIVWQSMGVSESPVLDAEGNIKRA